MVLMPVYLAGLGSFLPNAPVDNDSIERVLGMVGGRPSRSRRMTLRSNGILRRHYAIDPSSGAATHDNATLTAHAIRAALDAAGWLVDDLDLLACGTSSPDQLIPGHASMVHAALGAHPLEVVTMAGVCSSGIAALKTAWLSVRAQGARRAVATGSELASSYMRAPCLDAESDARIDALERRPELAFEADFLRWMLSDGAGAALLANEAVAMAAGADGTAPLRLRIDAIDGISLAHALPVCMYSGGQLMADGRLRGWRDLPAGSGVGPDGKDAVGRVGAFEAGGTVAESVFGVRQDARVLSEHISRLVSAETIGRFAAANRLRADDVSWFLPHLSSEFFRPMLGAALAASDFAIPANRWYTNLSTVGNVGSAALFLMLDGLLRTGKVSRGDRILCFVPESARFSVWYMLVTAE